MLRLASFGSDGRRLYAETPGGWCAVGEADVTDVAALIRAHPAASSLRAAVDDAGLGSPVGAEPGVPAPPVTADEVWAAGVTYERSRVARMAESRDEDVYDRVYRAARPELFFKATGPRVVGPGGAIGLRSDSAWQVPEPELALVLGPGARLLGFTLGNDVSSRDIEGENPLYLPQAKIFAGSCAIGPAVVPFEDVPDWRAFEIALTIERGGSVLFEESTSAGRIRVPLETLTEHLARDNWLPPCTVLFTGTGIVPPDTVSLQPGDEVAVACEPIGVLRNRCVPAASLQPPEGWTTGR